MKLEVTCQCPPIPLRNFDWACYDSDTYDISSYDGEAGRPVSDCLVGYGKTAEEAIIDFVQQLVHASSWTELNLC